MSVSELLSRRVGDHPELNVEVQALCVSSPRFRCLNSWGAPLRNEAITYRNPIELIIGGVTFIAYGTVQVLRMARDWGALRRMANAAADIAEAEARQARTRANLIGMV